MEDLIILTIHLVRHMSNNNNNNNNNKNTYTENVNINDFLESNNNIF